MQTITIDFHIPTSWSELSDKQLRYVYQLIADNVATDDKQSQREPSGGASPGEAPKAISSGYAECSRQCVAAELLGALDLFPIHCALFRGGGLESWGKLRNFVAA